MEHIKRMFENKGMGENPKIHLVLAKNLDAICATDMLGNALRRHLGFNCEENLRTTFAESFSLGEVEVRDDEFVFVVGIGVHQRDPQDTFEFIERCGDRLVVWYDNHDGWFEFGRFYGWVEDRGHLWNANPHGARFYRTNVAGLAAAQSLTDVLNQAHYNEFVSGHELALIWDGQIDASFDVGSEVHFSPNGLKAWQLIHVCPLDDITATMVLLWLMTDDGIYAQGFGELLKNTEIYYDFQIEGSVVYIETDGVIINSGATSLLEEVCLGMAPFMVIAARDDYRIAARSGEVNLLDLFADLQPEGNADYIRIFHDGHVLPHMLCTLNQTDKSLVSLKEVANMLEKALNDKKVEGSFRDIRFALHRFFMAERVQYTFGEAKEIVAEKADEVAALFEDWSPEGKSQLAVDIYMAIRESIR